MTKMNTNIIICGNKLDGRTVSEIKISDYNRLNPKLFINDAIMEFYLNYYYSRKLSLEDKNRTYIFNSFFYESLNKKIEPQTCTKSKIRHDRVKRWTKSVNVFEKDFIFIPINENEHWVLAVICFPYLTGPVNIKDNTELKKKSDNYDHSQIYDNINLENDEADGNTEDRSYFNLNYNIKNGVNNNNDIEKWSAVKQPCILIFDSLYNYKKINRPRIATILRQWLFEEYRAKHNGIKRDFSINTMKGLLIKVPQQPNVYDCGLFVMHYFEMFFKYPIVDYTYPITDLENWFPIDDVTKNSRKRKQIQQVLLSVMLEQGRTFPPGISLLNNFTQNFQDEEFQLDCRHVYELNSEYCRKCNFYHQYATIERLISLKENLINQQLPNNYQEDDEWKMELEKLLYVNGYFKS